MGFYLNKNINLGKMDFSSVKIHPTVLFTIVDSFERRKEDAKRVIGTLLGNIHGNEVVVTSCFCVPHNESKDEVAVDMESARTMTDFHVKTNPNEVIVGWYATGLDISAHSVLIHEYYCREAKNPIHLVIDTDIQSGDMKIKCFVKASIGVPGEAKKGTLFQPLETEIVYYDSERVTIDTINKGMSKLYAEKGIQRDTLLKLQTDYDTVIDSTTSLLQFLQSVSSYVDRVIKGELPMDPKVGRKLMDLMKLVPYMEEKEFSAMLNNNLNDTLIVRYLSEAVKSTRRLEREAGQHCSACCCINFC